MDTKQTDLFVLVTEFHVLWSLDKLKQGISEIGDTAGNDGEYLYYTLSKIICVDRSTKSSIYELRVNWLSGSRHQLVLNKIEDGEILMTELANIHHHGKWIEWLID